MIKNSIIAGLTIVLGLSSCGSSIFTPSKKIVVFGQVIGDLSNERTYDAVCINGVTYYEAYHRMSVALDRESKVIPCGK